MPAAEGPIGIGFSRSHTAAVCATLPAPSGKVARIRRPAGPAMLPMAAWAHPPDTLVRLPDAGRDSQTSRGA